MPVFRRWARRTRWLPWLLGGAILLGAGCRRSSAGKTGAAMVEGLGDPPGLAPRDGGTLSVHVDGEPPTLNPLVEHDVWTTWIALGPIYEPLLRQDATTGELRPALASAWSWTDPTTLRLTLRPSVSWHDGQPFSATDVVATLARLKGPGVAADRRADFQELDTVVASSPTEVVLHFRAAPALALQSLAHLPILPAHGMAAGDLRKQPISRAPVGTGPFRFVEWRAGERIVVERNANYWGARPHLEKVVFRLVRDREAAFELARRGELDIAFRLSTSQVERAQKDPALGGRRIVGWHLPTYLFIVWNARRPGLSDARVRRALTLLTDRARYLQVAYGGRAAPVTGPYPLGSPSYDATLAAWPYDPARARALLDEAGVRDTDGDGIREVGGKPFHINFLLTAGSKTLEPLVTMLQEDLQRAGVILDVTPTEWAVLLDRLRHHAFDASSLQWTMQPVQDNYDLFHSSQAVQGQNYGEFSDPEVDRVLVELRRTPPGPQRIRLDHEIHRLIHDLQPYTFIGCPEVDSLLATTVHGYRPDADGLGLERIWLDDGGGPRR